MPKSLSRAPPIAVAGRNRLSARARCAARHLASTQGIIGAAEIAAMKKGCYLINNSRGTVVDLEALATSLMSGHIGGAAIDVFPVEPPSNADAFQL